jgi:hypothetical protein
MMRTILIAATTAGVLVFTAGTVSPFGLIAAPAYAEPPDGKGTNTTETRSTGSPSNPNGFGSVTSQRAVDDHDIGEHASSQTNPRLGVGNVAAGDQAMFDAAGIPDTGTRPGDHAAAIGALTGYPATNRPGTHE